MMDSKYNFFLRRHFIILLFLLTNTISFSQSFNFQNYSLDDGLPQSEVNCIYEDSRGYLWIGTMGGGLCRFDGKDFKTYEEKDGLTGQLITSISEDADHSIWIGNSNGALYKFNGQTFLNFTETDKKYFSKNATLFIALDDNHNMIVGKENRIQLYNGKQFETLKIKGDTLKKFSINCFKKDSRNILWIGTNKGLLVLKNQTLLHISDADFITSANITSITEDINGNLWAIENYTAFYKIKIIGPSHYQVKTSKIDSILLPEKTTISTIHFDQQNQLWISTQNKGIFKFSNNTLKNFTQKSGLPIDNIKNIYEDRSGNLWFGTNGGGLVKFTNQAFTYFENLPGFNSPDIFAINADKKGNIWIGTSLNGVYKYDGKSSELISKEYLENETRSIFTDKSGKVWIGSTKGIQIYYENSLHKYISKFDIKNVRAIFEDRSGNIWIGTKGNGAYIDNGKEIKHLTNEDGLTNENVYAIVQTKDGIIWLGTGSGIFVVDNEKKIKHYDTKDGLLNLYAGSMIIDKFGRLWVGTDNGIARFEENVFIPLTTMDGLASGIVYLLNTDNYGNIWVGTNKGIDKISLNEKGEILSIRNYGKAEGFKGIECNSRSTCIDAEGSLWFGTIKGAIKFDPKEELLHKVEAPEVHLSEIQLFYEKEDWKKYSDSLTGWYDLPVNPVFPYNKNHITFYFSAISKTFPKNIKYSFKLEGFDKDWTPLNETPSATYSNLPAGTYKFIVKAINKAGLSNEIPCEFSFLIIQPFWNTWWFISICVISFILVIYFYNEYRKRKHHLYKERLEKIIKQRTSEIVKQRDEIEILLKEVHHRVKNNLQIINSLINLQSSYTNDEKSVELFREIRNRIRTISLIHEKLYKSKDYRKINIKEYINMLVENLIDTYSFNKTIDLKLDLEVQYFNLNTIIPLGLILNEIISNSFKYAFNEAGEGILEIKLNKSIISDEITLIVGDNGKGYNDELFKSNVSSLGLELMKILSEQLNGTIEKINKPGTYYIITFKPLKN